MWLTHGLKVALIKFFKVLFNDGNSNGMTGSQFAGTYISSFLTKKGQKMSLVSGETAHALFIAHTLSSFSVFVCMCVCACVDLESLINITAGRAVADCPHLQVSCVTI